MTADLAARLAEVAGRDAVRPGDVMDAVAGATPALVVEPDSPDGVARLLAAANDARLAVAPRGGGTKMTIGNAPDRLDVVLSTRRLDRVLEHAHSDMTATVEAGCTVAALQSNLAERGQRLGLDPPWPDRATVGGVVATNDSGPLRTRFGSVRNLMLGATIALADGTVARSGGKVVKNVAGYDLPKLFAGSLGTLGVLVSATFRVHPIPGETRPLTFAFSSASSAGAFLLRVADSRVSPACLQLRASSDDAAVAVDAQLEGPAGATDAQVARIAAVCGEGDLVDAGASVLEATARLRSDAAGELVIKVGVLPSEVGALVDTVGGLGRRWSLAVQSDGIGYARFEGEPGSYRAVLDAVRRANGVQYAVVDGCDDEARRGLDVWGFDGDALGLMRRVKAQFDPAGTLNPGRFVGGI